MNIRFFILLFFLLPIATIEAQEKLTNELIWYSNEFRQDFVRGGKSMNDGKHYTQMDANGNILKFRYKDGEKVDTLVTAKDLKDEDGNTLRFDSYQFSANENKLLVGIQTESIYRYSSKSYYYIFDLETTETIPLAEREKGKQQLADFSPNADKVAFVRNNDLFIYDIGSGEEFAVTDDGAENETINGALDWVYEEEFSFHKGFYWSPSGRYIAYYKFDESHVKMWQMEMYGGLYQDFYKFKYPKAGEDNSNVSIHAYDLLENNHEFVFNGGENDTYIPRIQWLNNDIELCVMKLNRHQNKLVYDLYNFNRPSKQSLIQRTIHTEESETYVEINDDLHFLDSNVEFIYTSEQDGYRHIYLVNFKKDKISQITKGDWVVEEIHAVNEDDKKIYYTSAESSPLNRDLYVVNFNGKGKKKLSEREGHNSPEFSKGAKYYINYHSDADTPYYISLHDEEGKQIRELVNNDKLKNTLKKYQLSPKEFFTFKTDDGIELNGWMIKPRDFDRSREYPVLLTIYNGPGANTVNNRYEAANYLWHQLLAQEENIIVVSVDGRGTGFKGVDFKKVTYQQLGKYETEDMIQTAKYLGGRRFIDADRIAIQGWSYGGYMASLCMTKGADYFKTGIAVAPVTNWRFYDTIYTERYMRTPQENPDGYDDNSPINHVGLLRGDYLLVHGSADDNVHLQNTMEMVDALVEANKQFDLFVYPNKNHGIYGGTTRLHLFNKMTQFLKDRL